MGAAGLRSKRASRGHPSRDTGGQRGLRRSGTPEPPGKIRSPQGEYERATLLETILDPSKAIAPEYYTYLVETERGQVFAGFLVEKTGKQVVLKDARGELVRIPIAEVTDMVKSDKSVMPDLVLRDVTAQDAADLLAFLVTLQ